MGHDAIFGHLRPGAAARNNRELVLVSCIALNGLKNKVPVMTANPVNPFEVFKSFVEFYPKLGATIALGAMAAAAKMIPTSSGVISATPQAKGPELVSPANISSLRKRSAAPKTSSSRKRSSAKKAPRKTSKRATGRRKAA